MLALNREKLLKAFEDLYYVNEAEPEVRPSIAAEEDKELVGNACHLARFLETVRSPSIAGGDRQIV
jgi:hypothetical protein